MRTGRPMTELIVSAEERATLERWVRRRSSAQALALRAGSNRNGLRHWNETRPRPDSGASASRWWASGAVDLCVTGLTGPIFIYQARLALVERLGALCRNALRVRPMDFRAPCGIHSIHKFDRDRQDLLPVHPRARACRAILGRRVPAILDEFRNSGH